MSIHIEFRDGLPRLLVPDADGEQHAYRFTIARVSERGAWTCELVRTDTGSEYTVTAYRDGIWTCTCPDATYRGHAKRDKAECKHVRAGRELQQLAFCLVAQDEEIQSLLAEAKSFFDGYAEAASLEQIL